MQAPVLLVEFVALKDLSQDMQYVREKRSLLPPNSGHSQLNTRIDQFLAGGEMPYHMISIDRFPDTPTAIHYNKTTSAFRESFLSQRYAFLVQADLRVSKLVKSFHFLSPLFRLFLGSGKERPMSNLDELISPEIGPTSTTVAALKTRDLDRPFFMMNLNKFYEKAQYPEDLQLNGEQAYAEYSKRIIPYLISVKGYPAIYGKIVEGLEEDPTTQLPDQWDEFIMVYYPSRRHFLRLMTNSPQKAAIHRNAGLERAVLMPCELVEG